jgi:hypothetical protein
LLIAPVDVRRRSSTGRRSPRPRVACQWRVPGVIVRSSSWSGAVKPSSSAAIDGVDHVRVMPVASGLSRTDRHSWPHGIAPSVRRRTTPPVVQLTGQIGASAAASEYALPPGSRIARRRPMTRDQITRPTASPMRRSLMPIAPPTTNVDDRR